MRAIALTFSTHRRLQSRLPRVLLLQQAAARISDQASATSDAAELADSSFVHM